mgnify:CR=1 FL=1
MASVSYAYAVGNVRAHEASLLSRQDLEQLLEDAGNAGVGIARQGIR